MSKKKQVELFQVDILQLKKDEQQKMSLIV